MEESKINLLSTMMKLKLFGSSPRWIAFGEGTVVACGEGWLVRCLRDKPGGRLVVTRLY